MKERTYKKALFFWSDKFKLAIFTVVGEVGVMGHNFAVIKHIQFKTSR